MDILDAYMKRNAVDVVTGADRGFGLELVRQLLQKGDRVFAGKYRKNWNDLEKLQEEYPDTLEIVSLNVANDESVKEACDYIKSKTDFVSILINNAGIDIEDHSKTILSKGLNFKNMAIEYNVNALGPLRMMNGLGEWVAKSMDKLIVNISSEAGSIANCYRTSGFGYCMSKAALNMASAITQNALKDVRVVNIHPGNPNNILFLSDISEDAPHTELSDMSASCNDFGIKYTQPAYNAECIVDMLMDPSRFVLKPEFITFRGTPIPW